MGFTDWLRDVATARDQLDIEVFRVASELQQSFGWTESQAEAFCFENKRNYYRIVHMRLMCGEKSMQSQLKFTWALKRL